MGLSAETIHIQRDHPIFQGGSSPHTVDGGLPTPPSLNVGGPRPAMPTGGDGVSLYGGAAPAPKKTMPAKMAENIRGEQLQRANTPFAGQPGPVKREAGAQGYDTTDAGLNMAQGYPASGNSGGPNLRGIGQSIGRMADAAKNAVVGAFGNHESPDFPQQYKAYQEDSAAVANARKYNR